ncbi:MAG: DUF2530 domain-containing protein [Pseudonocardiaceae bacterium]
MQPAPPPLPRSLANPRPAITVGTIAWFVAAVVLLVAGAPMSWVWTCVVGGLLGFVGFTVMYLQCSAAQRGSRLAQRGLL